MDLFLDQLIYHYKPFSRISVKLADLGELQADL